MSDPEILCQRHGPCGLITLNRPQALNALTHGMVGAIAAALAEWADDPRITRVVIEARGEKAFSAGGDIRVLYQASLAGEFAAPMAFWRDEYRLNRTIKRYAKPYVALVDGIVMGGGVGVSLLGSHVVAGDRFSFAMPEVGIGFFPDVGATHFLSHLPGQWGAWLALTGARITADTGAALGLAHARVKSADMASLKAALLAGDLVDEAIGRFARTVPSLPAADWVESGFAGDDALQILHRLALGGDAAQEAARQISQKSPTSIKVALRQIRIGRCMDIEAALQTEYRIVSRIGCSVEFREGVRAVVIDKDNQPRWTPATLDAVGNAAIDAIFAPLPDGDLTFDEYCGMQA